MRSILPPPPIPPRGGFWSPRHAERASWSPRYVERALDVRVRRRAGTRCTLRLDGQRASMPGRRFSVHQNAPVGGLQETGGGRAFEEGDLAADGLEVAVAGRVGRCWSRPTWSGAARRWSGGGRRPGSGWPSRRGRRAPGGGARDGRGRPGRSRRGRAAGGCRSGRPARRRTRSGTESRANRSRRTAHSPASGCTSQLSSGHSSAISGRATSSVTRPPSKRLLVAGVVAQRALVEALHQRHRRRRLSSGPSRPGHEVRVPVDEVGVHEHEQVAAGDEQRLPHRLALARVGAEVGADLPRAVYDGPGSRRHRVGLVGRVGVDHHDLVEQRGRLHQRRPHPAPRRRRPWPPRCAPAPPGSCVSPVSCLRRSRVVEVPVLPPVRALGRRDHAVPT